eukprot:TRINITY_DN9628_c0_g1_i1.p1 TRINITY_DN9628_c0_g1~~TRINITY_DN9628_c0_g1_i1.p1  ORF type:complete len:154 (+),score=47.74 TRINITY_DN9628_c0_g1_i1:40-501(+)
MSDGWKTITNDKNSQNWVILDVLNNNLVDGQVGEGFDSFVAAFNPSAIQFGAIRVTGVDEQASVVSKRAKFVQINWCGTGVAAFKKMNALNLKGPAASIFTSVALHIDANEADDISMADIARKLLASGGAHKPKYYDFGAGQTFDLGELRPEN